MARILVVDDESPIRELLAEVLADEGFAVLTAPDGLAALDLLAQHPTDLVLTDAMMPGLDGLQLVRRMRGDPRTRGIAVVVMSAAVIADEAALDGVGFLAKPFDLDELLRAVAAGLRPLREQKGTHSQGP